ncbi:MAG: FtsX-like permease family protein [Clostridia bacterium]|nr:FtsX-like permease family protein [Clostridia bacterium]
MLENFRQLISLVFRALLSNKTRSFLTMLGIIIGVAAVILIMSLGAGAQSLILSQLDGFGGDLIGILPGKSDEKGPPASVFGLKITTLTTNDAEALKNKNNVSHLLGVVSYYNSSEIFSYQDINYSSDLNGINGDYLLVETSKVDRGRFFTSEELDSNLRLVVLGSQVARGLFANSDPLGKKIKVRNKSVTVIGVMEERGQVGFSNYDNLVLAPLSFVQKDIAGVNYLSAIRVKVDSSDNVDESLLMIKDTLRERHDIDNPEDDDFSVRSFKDALDLVVTITDALRYFLAAMAAISLIVGGIGIMNIMLVSVTERTREIGLRKALGATRRQVLNQFLFEAIALTLVGGIIGLFIGTMFSYLISIVIRLLDYNWDFVISISSVLVAIGISIIIGIIFGYYPAKRASDLSPIEALRYE